VHRPGQTRDISANAAAKLSYRGRFDIPCSGLISREADPLEEDFPSFLTTGKRRNL
jgi:hypothetical protein